MHKYWITLVLVSMLIGCAQGFAQAVSFPPQAGVKSIKDFGAKGDGLTDDTEAFKKAVALGVDDNRFIYIPNGTYLLSDTIGWARRRTLMGQSRDGVILKLKDKAPGFAQGDKPKAFIHAAVPGGYYGHDSWANAAFDNYLQNLTIDTGSDNPAAIGLLYTTHNNGMVEGVTIRSDDGQGVIGLDLSQTEFGPGMISQTRIDGFDVGIKTPGNVSNAVFEDITLVKQRVVGIENYHPIVIRKLRSENSVPAIRHSDLGLPHLVLIDAVLNGGDAANVAIESKGDYYLRNVMAQGYKAVLSDGGEVVAGMEIKERFKGRTNLEEKAQVLGGVSLVLPVEEPPAVFQEPAEKWLVLESSGKDDTAAIQKAMDSGAKTIFFKAGEYRVSQTIRVPASVRRILSVPGATLRGTREIFGIGDLKDTSRDDFGGNKPFLRIEGNTRESLSFERLNFSAWPFRVHGIEIASARPVLTRHGAMGHPGGEVRNTPESVGGKLFLVESSPDLRVKGDYHVWMRQWNPENNPFDPKSPTMKKRTYLVNDGATVWILGYKTEAPAIHAITKNGGKTEILGGFFRDHFGGQDIGGDEPYFITQDAWLSAMYVQYGWKSGKARALQGVETQGDQTREFILTPDTLTVGLYSVKPR